MLYLNKAGNKMNTKMILNEYYDKMNYNKYIGIKEYNQFLDKLYNKYRNEIINNKDLQLLFNQENENLEKHNQKYIEETRKTFWIKNLFDDHEFVEEFPDAEERRVFYVALTRTKKDVYLLTPREESKESPFVRELLESEI